MTTVWILSLSVLCPLLYFLVLIVTQNSLLALAQLLCLALPAFAGIKVLKLDCLIKTKPTLSSLLQVVSLFTILALILNGALNLLQSKLAFLDQYEELLRQLLHPGSVLGLLQDLLVAALIPALCEELFFRGFVLEGLLKEWSKRNALAISAFLFAIYHLNPWLVPIYFGLGWVLGWVYLRYRSLPLAMLGHFLNNAIGVGLYHWYF